MSLQFLPFLTCKAVPQAQSEHLAGAAAWFHMRASQTRHCSHLGLDNSVFGGSGLACVL